MPLRQANSELSEKSGMLQVEKKLLEEEIKRWKARTQVCAETKSPAVLSRSRHGYVCHFMTLWKQVHSCSITHSVLAPAALTNTS